jgi:outer membrane protein OmpA-like peptidoglycan-associated protein
MSKPQSSRKRILRAGTLLLGAVLSTATALAQDKPLKESQVTERALVEALAPRPAEAPPAPAVPASAADGDVTRGFKLAPAAPPPRKQSILITFNTNSADLLPSTRKMLEIVARALQSERLAALKVVVEGHADPRGDEAGNRRLSQARAQSVVDYLVREQRIPAERLTAVGKGSSELMNRAVPTAPENRRVSLVTQAQ